MMRKRIPIGIEFYKEMMDKDYYYVDKTLLMKENCQVIAQKKGRKI